MDDRPDLAQILPTVYDLTAWLQKQERALETPENVRRSLIVVNAHIANNYWAEWD